MTLGMEEEAAKQGSSRVEEQEQRMVSEEPSIARVEGQYGA